jgi:hypothetical protein
LYLFSSLNWHLDKTRPPLASIRIIEEAIILLKIRIIIFFYFYIFKFNYVKKIIHNINETIWLFEFKAVDMISVGGTLKELFIHFASFIGAASILLLYLNYYLSFINPMLMSCSSTVQNLPNLDSMLLTSSSLRSCFSSQASLDFSSTSNYEFQAFLSASISLN